MSVASIFETMEYGPAPEASGPAEAWLDGHGRQFGHFIAGAWVPGSGHFESLNPATGKPLARIAQATQEEVDRAVAAAREALPAWSATPGHVRARHLYALARQVQKNSRLLAVLETLDNGKPIRETRDIDVPLVARHFYHHAGWAQLAEREFEGYQPVGVVGQIIPWNFPLLMLAWKVAPALAMGNTVVLKPAEFTSVTALAFAELVAAVGLPPGVLNIVTGDGKVGAMLVEHPDVDKIAFTGSTEVGPAHPQGHRRHGEEAVPGAGREEPVRRLRGRRPRQRRGGRRRRHLVQPGPGLLRRLAPPRPGERRTSASSRSCASGWSACASATRSTRPWTSAPSWPPCSSSASAASCGRASRKGRSCGSPRGPAPPRAGSSPPPSSPTWPPPPPSPRSRSSGRSSCR